MQAETPKTLKDMQRMDTQMKAKQAMHEKMMLTKTSEERSTLMADHTKTMQGDRHDEIDVIPWKNEYEG